MNFKQLAQTIATAATLLIAQPIQAETFYFHNDHLGTPQALTDDSGTVVWQGNYSPFGEVNETTDTVEQNIRFPGQYFEEETGLHYNYFRDYDPGTGRYIESDPIGLDGGINTFGYAGGEPISRIDPTGELAIIGLWPFVAGGGGAAAGGTAAAGGVSWGTAIAGGVGLWAIMSTPGSTSTSSAVAWPSKPKRGWVCNCRASSNGQQPGNCPADEFAFGTASGSSYKDARAKAEKSARQKLGKQAKHTQCKCVDNKGNRRAN